MRLATAALPFLAGALICGFVCPARADDLQSWQTLRANVKLSPHITLTNETIVRSGNQRGFYDLTDNLMLGYAIDSHISAWIGYTHQSIMQHGSLLAIEHRLRPQLSFDSIARIGPVRIGGRLRLEARWRDNAGGTGWRIRPQVKLTLPLASRLSVSLTHEQYFDLNRTPFQTVGGLERTRSALVLSTALSKHVGIDFGYLEQHGFLRGRPDTNDHVATIALTGSF